MTHDKVVHGVENVGVDYGVYRYYANDEKLLVIVGNKANAELIAEILNNDWHGKNHGNKGEWISHYDEGTKEGWYECSCCHSERAFNTNFCPDCGADMREPIGKKGTE